MFPPTKSLYGEVGGWVSGVSSIQVLCGFFWILCKAPDIIRFHVTAADVAFRSRLLSSVDFFSSVSYLTLVSCHIKECSVLCN